jgi:hypothetical protein
MKTLDSSIIVNFSFSNFNLDSVRVAGVVSGWEKKKNKNHGQHGLHGQCKKKRKWENAMLGRFS